MILVVDDDQRIIEALRESLTREGYTVKTAHDGLEAFGHLRAPECKCMLLDINMPRINGVELLLLMQSEGIKVPTIVMAGFEDFDEKEMKQFSNVVKYLHKPFEMKDMLKAIRAHALK
jgi:DNA-binding response OmpR family regulator